MLKATEISLTKWQFLQETAENYSWRFPTARLGTRRGRRFEMLQFGERRAARKTSEWPGNSWPRFTIRSGGPSVFTESMPSCTSPSGTREIDLPALPPVIWSVMHLPFQQDLTPFWERIHDVEHSILARLRR